MAYKKAEREYTFCHDQETLKDTVEAIAPLSTKQENFLDCKSDIVLWSGGQNSGKSFLCIVDLLIGAVDDKYFTATIARTSLKKIKQSGGLFDTSYPLFKSFGASSNQLELTYNIPNGSRIKFAHLHNNIDAFQGSNNTMILVDEAAEEGIEEEHIAYLITRLRGRSKRKKQIKMTGNPSSSSFIREWLEKGEYLTEEGYHREDMDGVESYMVQVGGSFEFFRTKKDIENKYNKEIAKQALTFTSFDANIYANPVALADPFNLHTLKNLKEHEVERLLYGNWYSADDSSSYLKKDMFKEINKSGVPLGLPVVRAWDLASSKVGEQDSTGKEELFPDYTVGIKAAYDPDDGSFYILEMERFQDSSAIVMDTIIKTAKRDGKETYVSIPQDPGSAGRMMSDYIKTRLMKECSSRVIIDKTSKSKLKRAEPFIIAAQEGKVHVVKNLFLEEHWQELQKFNGERSTRHYKDDIADAISSAYTSLAQGNLIPSIKVSSNPNDKSRLMAIGGRTLL